MLYASGRGRVRTHDLWMASALTNCASCLLIKGYLGISWDISRYIFRYLLRAHSQMYYVLNQINQSILHITLLHFVLYFIASFLQLPSANWWFQWTSMMMKSSIKQVNYFGTWDSTKTSVIQTMVYKFNQEVIWPAPSQQASVSWLKECNEHVCLSIPLPSSDFNPGRGQCFPVQLDVDLCHPSLIPSYSAASSSSLILLQEPRAWDLVVHPWPSSCILGQVRHQSSSSAIHFRASGLQPLQ